VVSGVLLASKNFLFDNEQGCHCLFISGKLDLKKMKITYNCHFCVVDLCGTKHLGIMNESCF
jgi:hypothetical protein